MSSVLQILENFDSVKIQTLAELVGQESGDQLEPIIARMIIEGQLTGFIIDGEYIVREVPDVDRSEIGLRVLDHVVTYSGS